MLEAYKEGEDQLGKAVSALSLGWGLGTMTVAFLPYQPLYSLSFAFGSVMVFLAVSKEPAKSGLLAAVPKLLPLLPPLALFMGAEYVVYALTALRFYEATNRIGFALAYAVGPSLTAALGGYVAGKALRKLGAERLFLISVIAYIPVTLLALASPPPICLVAWSIPVYPFYEVSLVALVSKFVPEAPASALGLTYTTMSIASIVAIPFTRIKSFRTVAIYTSIAMVLSAIFIKLSFRALRTPRRSRDRREFHTSPYDSSTR
ncbi:hypothetical protein IPA_02140 [Ignicoccus pacificus DSM 13166]|uniref:Uncharacterized protein n=1 Tax=Ignicoccus pacificus DSM 13166 TaxID=940294 RepID=A0A977KAM8_9CREN|nr:hypothetical protein IPA_02140 [Ignicoccus pacificus DSM 13166]